MKAKLKIPLVFLEVLSASNLARSQGTVFTFQVRLDSGGSQAGGNHDLRFTIYDSSSAT